MFEKFEISDFSLNEEALELLKPLNEEESQEIIDNFSAAVRAVVKTVIEEQVVPHYETEAERVVSEENESTTAKITDYLEYVVSEFVEEQKEAIQESLKLKSNEKLIENMKNVLTSHGITLSEETDNVVETLNNRIVELEEQLHESQEELVEIRTLEKGRACEKIFEGLCEGLTISQREKFSLIVEDLDIDDIQLFETKATKIRDTFFPKKKAESTEPKPETTEVVEEEFKESIEPKPDNSSTQQLKNPYVLAARFSS